MQETGSRLKGHGEPVFSDMLEVKESERLVRGAQSLARLGTSVLQTMAQSSTLMARPNDPRDVFMGDGNSDVVETAKQSKRWRRRHKKSAQEKEPAHEVLALTDTDVVEPESATGKSSRGSLRPHFFASSSPPLDNFQYSQKKG